MATPLDVKSGDKPPFRTPVFHRRYIQRGINHAMSYEGIREESPMIQLPIRSSLAQAMRITRVQLSHYISWIRPYGMAPGYPTAKVYTLINTSPKNRSLSPKPRIPNRGINYAFAQGAGARSSDSSYYMGSPRRFRKALPVSLVQYTPPTY